MTKKKLVVLTGAGISAESGLRTFRDSDGLWEGYNVEDVATPRAWRRDPQLVLNFYNERRRNVLAAQPNGAHKALAELEQYFDVHIITQNIDDLHERAGSTKILHLHGEILKMRSVNNEFRHYPITTDIMLGDVAEDGGQLRPHIVWFEEPVPMMEQAAPIVYDADIFAVIGTSLVVYPAAGLVHYARPEVTKYVVDKSIPHVGYADNVVTIEQPATEGVVAMAEILKSKHL
jgi:NAD-dependent deacetylase